MFRKIAAGLMLLLLSAILIIQVSHSHGNVRNSAAVVLKKYSGTAVSTSNAESKCFICDYQLTRDADAVTAFVTPFYHTLYPAVPTFIIASVPLGCTDLSVSRGPPAMA